MGKEILLIFGGLMRSGLARLGDVDSASLSLESRFDLSLDERIVTDLLSACHLVAAKARALPPPAV